MQLRQRRRDAERLAEQAWDNLTAAVETTGRRTRTFADRAGSFADRAGSRMTAAGSKMTETSEEARRRAGAAMDALAGRKPRRAWNWLAGALALGTVLGWLTAVFGRRAVNGAATQTRHMLERKNHDDTPAADLGELTGTPDMTGPRPM